MSGVNRYKAIDSKQFGDLLVTWLNAASILANECGSNRAYLRFRNTLLVALEKRSYETDILSIIDGVNYYLILSKDTRNTLMTTWARVKSTLNPRFNSWEAITSMDEAVSALRVTPDDSGKIERLLNE
jgi:hypothetical protein